MVVDSINLGCIWLIGGTSESAELANQLIQRGIPLVVTVTTESARSLYPALTRSQVWIGRLTPQTIRDFIQTHQIRKVLDASHPFAVEISQLAIATAAQMNLPYLRFERPSLKRESTAPLIDLDTLETLLAGEYLSDQRVLLTLGYRYLAQFQPWQPRATLFARILPSIPALTAALAAGFSSDRLIALRPPVALELERAIWQHWQITTVVTKASGLAGGELIKRQLAREMGVRLILINRPSLQYPCQTHDLTLALEFCRSQEL